MNPFQLSMLQSALGNNAPANLGNMRMSQIMGNLPPEARAAMARASTQQSLANKPQGMDVPQTYLWAMANHISPAQLGLTAGQIYASEQGLTGYHMDPQTGQITKANPAAPGGREAVNPQTLGATINTNLGGSFGMENGQMVGDAAWINNAPGSYNIQPGQSGYGNAPGGAGAAVNNLGGGTGNPNNAAGQGGLYGAAGNAIRQQMMDSSQFNPNGANTYAIQNMNLSGQGDLGSNMGGVPSNGLFNGAVPTAAGNGATTGVAIPQTLGAANSGQMGTVDPNAPKTNLTSTSNTSVVPPNPANTTTKPINPYANNPAYQTRGGANGTFTGVINNGNGITSANPALAPKPAPAVAPPPPAVAPPRYFTNPNQFQNTGGGGGRVLYNRA
jgi:hypothetical protein